MPAQLQRDESASGDEPRGAYGLRITGIDANTMLVPAAHDWPHLRLVHSFTDAPLSEERLTEERAELRLRAGGSLAIDRATGVARFLVPRPLTDHELVHPLLAPAAAVMAHWLDRPCFHAGAFVHDGGVWALLGDRESGKSSMLAWLALHDHSVVADDILVLDGSGSVYAGPRSIDLREETAERLGVGVPLGRLGTRARWRMSLPAIEGQLPLRGWFFLQWGDSLDVTQQAPSDCVTRLLQQLTVRIQPPRPESLLELAGLPAWELRRPRDWNVFERAANLLLETAAHASDGRRP